METESALAVYTVIVPGYNIFFAFQTPVGVMEPTPNWNSAGLRDYKKRLGPRGLVTMAPGPTATNRGPTTTLQYSRHLSPVFQFNQCVFVFQSA